MPAEERRYIIYQHYFNRRYFKDIADELGIKKQVISNDHRRHKEIWDQEREWLEFFLKGEFNKHFSKSIKKARADLMDLLCRIKELDERKSKLTSAVKNNTIKPEDFAKFLKHLDEMENVFVSAEIKMHIWLTQLLQRSSEISQSSVEELKDLITIEIDPQAI